MSRNEIPRQRLGAYRTEKLGPKPKRNTAIE